jgi:hypothetical protein
MEHVMSSGHRGCDAAIFGGADQRHYCDAPAHARFKSGDSSSNESKILDVTGFSLRLSKDDDVPGRINTALSSNAHQRCTRENHSLCSRLFGERDVILITSQHRQ